jgi:hypothetical protein
VTVKRALPVVALLALGVSACRTAGPDAPPGFADPVELLRPWVGRVLILRHVGDRRSVSLRAGERARGGCDVAVRVHAVDFERGAAQLSLLTLGLPSVEGRRAQCEETRSGLQLTLQDFPAAPARADVQARLEAVLQTPEAYLAAKRVSFDLEPAALPEVIARPGADGPTPEITLGRKVTAWPLPLLELQAWYSDPSGRVQHLGEVEVDAIVGLDGRLHAIEPQTSLAEGQREALLRGMELWRFRPATTAEGPVAARVSLKPVLRIF